MSLEYKIGIRRVIEEEYEMTLTADSAMGAYDQAKQLVDTRNKRVLVGKYSVVKVEEIKKNDQ